MTWNCLSLGQQGGVLSGTVNLCDGEARGPDEAVPTARAFI